MRRHRTTLLCAITVAALFAGGLVARADDAWRKDWSGTGGQQGRDWRQDAPRGGPQGTTTYLYYKGPDGQQGRCAQYRWRGEPVVSCQ